MLQQPDIDDVSRRETTLLKALADFEKKMMQRFNEQDQVFDRLLHQLTSSFDKRDCSSDEQFDKLDNRMQQLVDRTRRADVSPGGILARSTIKQLLAEGWSARHCEPPDPCLSGECVLMNPFTNSTQPYVQWDAMIIAERGEQQALYLCDVAAAVNKNSSLGTAATRRYRMDEYTTAVEHGVIAKIDAAQEQMDYLRCYANIHVCMCEYG
eukprot:18659-Heterococcus_DN1.PRE.3